MRLHKSFNAEVMMMMMVMTVVLWVTSVERQIHPAHDLVAVLWPVRQWGNTLTMVQCSMGQYYDWGRLWGNTLWGNTLWGNALTMGQTMEQCSDYGTDYGEMLYGAIL